MAKFEIQMDIKKFKPPLLGEGRGYAAVRETIRVQGMGETITSARKKEKWEKKRAKHGRLIAWYFRSKGRDPFLPSGADFDSVNERLKEEFGDALTLAHEKRRPQAGMIKDALRMAGTDWANAVKDRIKKGFLGRNTEKVRRRKTMMVKMGLLPSKYGATPPRGIASGRFIEGIRGRWRQGRL